MTRIIIVQWTSENWTSLVCIQIMRKCPIVKWSRQICLSFVHNGIKHLLTRFLSTFQMVKVFPLSWTILFWRICYLYITLNCPAYLNNGDKKFSFQMVGTIWIPYRFSNGFNHSITRINMSSDHPKTGLSGFRMVIFQMIFGSGFRMVKKPDGKLNLPLVWTVFNKNNIIFMTVLLKRSRLVGTIRKLDQMCPVFKWSAILLPFENWISFSTTGHKKTIWKLD